MRTRSTIMPGIILVVILLASLSLAAWGNPGEGSAAEPGAVKEEAYPADILERLESILRDPTSPAQERIDEALDNIEEYQHEGRNLLPPPLSPSPGPWSSFSWPFGDDDWNPFRELDRMRFDMNRLFDNSLARMQPGRPSVPFAAHSAWLPQGEFEEKEDAYVYRFDLPGVDKGEVTVTVKKGQLIVEGHRESLVEESNEDKNFFRRETRHGRFRRAITLPSDVDIGGAITSELEDGVLTVTLPKKEGDDKEAPRKVEVR